MNNLSEFLKMPVKIEGDDFRSQRDELVAKMTDGINLFRIGTQFKPLTRRTVAIRINKNPFLAKDNGEIYHLYKQCMEKKSFARFFWITK